MQANGNKWYFVDGVLHREDGPAMDNADGSKEWYIRGVKFSEEQFVTVRAMLNKTDT